MHSFFNKEKMQRLTRYDFGSPSASLWKAGKAMRLQSEIISGMLASQEFETGVRRRVLLDYVLLNVTPFKIRYKRQSTWFLSHQSEQQCSHVFLTVLQDPPGACRIWIQLKIHASMVKGDNNERPKHLRQGESILQLAVNETWAQSTKP